MFSRNAILADLLNTKLVTAKVGLIARGVADYSDIILAVEAATNTPETLAEVPLHVALVGYNAKPDNRSNLVIAIRAEDAVAWRNQPRLAGRIIVFVQGQADKLHSLNDFTTLGSDDLTAHLLQVARQKLVINQPQEIFLGSIGNF